MENKHTEKFIEALQNKIIKLLKTLSDDLQIASKDRCSEIVRLVGCWILDECPEYVVKVCKGTFPDESAHDVLVAENGKSLFLIDPTIWQKFSESENIFVGSADNTQEAIDLLERKYGGIWEMSEIMQKCTENYQQELLKQLR